jgi:hypothetical protein
MKNLVMLITITMLMFSVSCARNNQQLMGAMGGAAGAGAALYQGLNPTALALYTISGVVGGMYVGDAIDQKKQKDRDNDQYYTIDRNRAEARAEAERLWKEAEARQASVNVYNSGGSGGSVPTGNTNCEKVTRRQWSGGKIVSETTEEVCRGQRNTSMY